MDNANVGYYGNHLKKLLDDPKGFSGTPGFAFARDQGLSSIGRSNSRMRGSGNALAALTKFGTGIAMQDYGSYMDRLGRLQGQEQQYDLGERRIDLDRYLGDGQLSLGRDRLGLDRELGMGRLGLDRDLGMGKLGLERDRLGWDKELGRGELGLKGRGQLFDYDINSRRTDNDRENNWLSYTLGADRNNLTAAEQQNNFGLANERNRLDWYRAGTERGGQRSADWARREEARRYNRDPWGSF